MRARWSGRKPPRRWWRPSSMTRSSSASWGSPSARSTATCSSRPRAARLPSEGPGAGCLPGKPASRAWGSGLLKQASGAQPFGGRVLDCEWGERPAVVGRDMSAQVGAAFLVAFVFNGPELMEQGHQVAPAVGDQHIARVEALDELLSDAASQLVDAAP